MKTLYLFSRIILTIYVLVLSFNCSEEPISANLDHNLMIDTLTITEISLSNYNVAPNLATNERLYVGSKDGINIPYSFFKMAASNYWLYHYDSLITIDSVCFKLYSNDSMLAIGTSPNLFFSPDSFFNENLSTYLDYDGFNTEGWHDMGPPDSVVIGSDTNSFYALTELNWRIDSLMNFLADTLDSNLNRTFLLKYVNNDSNFIELYSEEATIEEKDPKIIIYYRQTSFLNDSLIIDTTFKPIYGNGDLSIFDLSTVNFPTDDLILSNGLGKRAVCSFSFPEDIMPEGAIIRKGNLILSIDSTAISSNFNIIIDPIESDTSVSADSVSVYMEDPYNTIGYPYRLSKEIENNKYNVAIKNFLQNIFMGNEKNLGFKIVADEKNNPFESIRFIMNDPIKPPKIEIVYVYNKED
tara:strand:+ start:1292 stop:2524 length:1233 start_codon:yes stop_codon:yes gene_type:complete